MNRRIVLLDEEITNPASYFGCGLGNEIYSIQLLRSLSEDDLKKCLCFGESDGIMLIGKEPFDFLRTYYHFGVRSENFSDCAKLRRLSIEGGAFVKEILDFPTPEEIQDFMSPDFAKPVDFGWFKHKVLHNYQETMKMLDYFDSLPLTQDFGFDYEASGMPLDKQFEVSGAALCTENFGGFISFTDIRHNNSAEEYQTILKRLGDFLVKRMEHIWTYNMQYEFQVSHRILGVDLYNLCDASVVNVLDGYHLKKYSLKWTAQRILGATVWDTEFDYISDLIDSMLFETVGKLKKDKHKELKVTPQNFKNTPEWAELCKRYPDYIGEFESLILEYWGNAFMPIPSEILGKYCCLDSFYTLMIYKVKEKEYNNEAWNVFMDNIRLASRLHSCGIPKDEIFRAEYNDYCEKQMAWGITYCAEARCRIKMNKHQAKMANINKYNPIAIKLLRQNNFFNGNTSEIAKYILSTHVDLMDSSEIGLNEGQLLFDYGPEFAEKFIELTKEAMEEVGMIKEKIDRKTKTSLGKEIKSKIDDGVVRKKKLISIVGEKLIPILGLDQIKINDKHIELEKYLYYERAYLELMKISQTQLNDINNIPDNIYAFGQNMSLQEYSDFISDNYFKCKSPEEDVEICKDFAGLYKAESAYLTAILESTQQLNGAEKYYENLGITTVEDGFNHFMCEWKKYCEGVPVNQTAYPEKMYSLALEYYNHLDHDNVRETWNNFNGYIAQSQLFPYVNDQCEEYEIVFDEPDLGNNFFFMRKFLLNYLRYKKHSKLKSTYVGPDGMFGQTDLLVIENPDSHVMIREADPGEEGAIVKMRPHFSCMEKSSKRWSSGYHTIISHSDIKRTVCSYPGHLLTYFDIN